MTLEQFFMVHKIEYHWLIIKMLRKRREKLSGNKKNRSIAAENLHRYKAEQTLVRYEITIGLRDAYGFWKQ